MHFDLFNGDADGILSLLQLRLAKPKSSTLITGVKRDIQLLKRVNAVAGDSITVLDISLDKNAEPLALLLQAGVTVEYFDHHQADKLTPHPNLTAHINTAANCCTALLVDNYLAGRYRRWAIVAAYGDNVVAVADKLAKQAGLTNRQAQQLRELGTLLNYNSYGDSVSDLHIAPTQLFSQLLPYACPLDFIAASDSPFRFLQQAFAEDMALAQQIQPLHVGEHSAVYDLGSQPWSRRISGVFGNTLANRYPRRAHAVLTGNADGSHRVSVRAPLANKIGADTLCSQFVGGGGRQAAAGINRLPAAQLSQFIQALINQYS
ncbi:hypothetical protein [Ferrimonas senticii]|uniref:hypothetical protein n=1 Tax=Ferrimonas senticii TaxID=394566 RepID=UPI0004013537|nr:hypothetical protein [Ferrimonas senticii]